MTGRVSRPGQRPPSNSSAQFYNSAYDPTDDQQNGHRRPASVSSSAVSRNSHHIHGARDSHPSYSSRGSELNNSVSGLNSTFPSRFDETQDTDVQLKKKVGLVSCVGLIVGTMIGSGIFISPTGVAKYSGSVGQTMIWWTFGGVIATFGALAYAELGTLIVQSGAEYSYLLAAFGPTSRKAGDFLAFLFSWVNMVLLKPASVSIITLTFARYVLEPFFTVCEEHAASTKCLAALVILIVSLINCRSVRASIWLQNILTVAKLIAIVIIIIGGFVKLAQGRTEQLSKGFTNAPGAETTAGNVAIAIYTAMWAYDGWNNLNYVTEEIINPYRNLPLAIIIAIPLVTVCYVLVNISYFTVMSLDEIATSSAVAVTWGNRVLGVMSWIIPFFVACSTFGAANGTLFSAGRLPYVSARGGHMVEVAGMVHVRYITPLPAIVFTMIMSLIFIIPGDILALIDFFRFAVWFFYCLTMVALVLMRFWGPYKDVSRPFRVFLPLPIIVGLFALFLIFAPIVYEPRLGYLFAFLFIIGGVVLYIPFVVFAETVHPKIDVFMTPFTLFLQNLMEMALPTEETAANLHESTR